MKNFLKRILTILRNKYVLATLIFLVLLIFFDKNNLVSQFRLSKKLNKLRREKNFYQDEILTNKNTIHDLNANPESLEKYAREKYFMKRDSEDIFVIIDKKSEEK